MKKFERIITALLSAVFLVNGVCFAALSENFQHIYPNYIENVAMHKSTQQSKLSDYSYKYDNLQTESNFIIRIPTANADFASVFGKSAPDNAYISQWIYSGKSTSGKLLPVFLTCGNTSTYPVYIPLDWEGWKLVTIKLSDFQKIDFSNISRINYCRKYGSVSIENDNNVSLFFDPIIYLTDEIPDSGNITVLSSSVDNNSEEVPIETKKFIFYLDRSLGSGDLTDNVSIKNNENIINSGYRAYANENKVFVVFDNELEINAAYEILIDGGYKIYGNFCGKNKLEFKTQSSEIEVKTYANGKSALSMKDKDDITALTEANEGNLFMASYGNNGNMRRIAVNTDSEAGKEVIMQNIDSNNEAIMKIFMLDSLQSLIPLRKEVVIKNKISDLEKIKSNWRSYLVGDSLTNTKNEFAEQKLQTINSEAEKALEEMNKSNNALFGTARITTTGAMTGQYNKLLALARAYGTYGAQLYNSEELCKKIKSGLEWLYNNLYGVNEINGIGWMSTNSYNWWDWCVGTPTALCDILIIMGSEVSRGEVDKYLSLLNYLRSEESGNAFRFSSESVVYVITAADMLTDKESVMSECIKYADEVLARVEKGDGIHDDFSYVCHNNNPYNVAYGTEIILNRVALLSAILRDTQYSFPDRIEKRLTECIKHMFEPVMYKGKAMSCMAGRDIDTGDAEQSLGAEIIVGAINLASEDSDSYEYLKSFIVKHLTKDNINSVNEQISISKADLLSEVIAEQSQTTQYQNCVVYNESDRIVQQRSEYAVAVSMSSSRIGNYESINGNNMTAWYTGDGMLYIYNDTPLEQNLYNEDFWKNVNPYRIPGTTVDNQLRDAVSIKSGSNYMSSKDFVGGVSLNSQFGAAAMELESFHNEKNGVTSQLNGDLPLHNCSLTAKKSWFMFDNEIVALGAGISSNDNAEVSTIVENKMLSGQTYGTEDIYVDSTLMEKGRFRRKFTNAGWLNINGVGGYYFPEGGKLTLNKLGSAPEFIEAWLDHGTNPNNAEYSYVLLPKMTPEQTNSYSQNPDISIIENSQTLQAVYDKSTCVTGYIFWQDGTCGDISASAPMIIMEENQGSEITLAISDPTHKADNAILTLNGLFDEVNRDSRAVVEKGSLSTQIKLNFSGAKGRTITVKVKKSA